MINGLKIFINSYIKTLLAFSIIPVSLVIGVLLALLAIPFSLIVGTLLGCFIIIDPYV